MCRPTPSVEQFLDLGAAHSDSDSESLQSLDSDSDSSKTMMDTEHEQHEAPDT